MWTATCVHNNFSRDKKEKGCRNTDSTKYVVWSWRLLFWSSASSTWFVKNKLYFVLSCFPFWCFQPGLLVTSWVVVFFSSACCVLFLCSWTLVEIFVQNPLWGDLVARWPVGQVARWPGGKVWYYSCPGGRALWGSRVRSRSRWDRSRDCGGDFFIFRSPLVTPGLKNEKTGERSLWRSGGLERHVGLWRAWSRSERAGFGRFWSVKIVTLDIF